MKRYQTDPVYHEVVTEPESVPTMLHRFIAVAEGDKVRVAADIASGPGRTLLFVRTQRGAERLVRLLDQEGLAAGAIHGGLSQPKRERALAAFSRGSMPVLVATNIAARGIHVDGVDIVVHHDPPEDTKTYLHRSGRTARAGASGLVVTLVSPEQARDVNVLRREAGVREAVVPMNPGDARLRDLAAWEPPLDDHAATQEPRMGARPHNGRPWHANREPGATQTRRAPRGYAGRRPAANGSAHMERRPDGISDADFRPSGPRRPATPGGGWGTRGRR